MTKFNIFFLPLPALWGVGGGNDDLTSVNVQCAHGRPTTVPLVNLEALHKQIKELEILGKSGSNGTWNGLGRHKLSIERMLQRLGSAEGL